MRPLLLAAFAALACAPRAHAQITLELRVGAAMGAYEATSAGFQAVPGPSIGATLGYAFNPRIEAFAGIAREQFGCEEGFCEGIEPTFIRSGAEAGLRFALPARLWVRGAVALQSLSSSSIAHGGDDSSGGSVGIRLGTGIGFPVSPRLTLTPGLEYSRFNTDLDGGDDGVGVLTAGLGLRIRL
jgi:opacity protein-like surface antigen